MSEAKAVWAELASFPILHAIPPPPYFPLSPSTQHIPVDPAVAKADSVSPGFKTTGRTCQKMCLYKAHNFARTFCSPTVKYWLRLMKVLLPGALGGLIRLDSASVRYVYRKGRLFVF